MGKSISRELLKAADNHEPTLTAVEPRRRSKSWLSQGAIFTKARLTASVRADPRFEVDEDKVRTYSQGRWETNLSIVSDEEFLFAQAVCNASELLRVFVETHEVSPETDPSEVMLTFGANQRKRPRLFLEVIDSLRRVLVAAEARAIQGESIVFVPVKEDTSLAKVIEGLLSRGAQVQRGEHSSKALPQIIPRFVGVFA